MKKIFKYPLKLTERQTVEVPQGAEFISAQFQGDQLFVWAIVKPENPKVKVTIEIFGTGHPISEEVLRNHIATVHEDGFVWHLFAVVAN